MKKRIKFPLSLFEEDMSVVSGQVFLRSYQRLQNETREIVSECENLFDVLDITGLQKKINLLNTEWGYFLQDCASAIEIINAARFAKETSLSPDTEVLEDLPDLEEDSLGVDSGSE
jgi:hypothetical protein